eukprot:502982-Amphidinium_carterae.1
MAITSLRSLAPATSRAISGHSNVGVPRTQSQRDSSSANGTVPNVHLFHAQNDHLICRCARADELRGTKLLLCGHTRW